MDQIYPLEGPATSCASQDFDFLNYWVDQTVEREISRGKKLRELKERPSIRKEKYDVINIGHTKKKHSKRRHKSPVKSKKKVRRHSPQRKTKPIRIFRKKESKSEVHRCPMRIAELSVPTKRQCIDTWRTKYHVLPCNMIDRLRKHVLDLSPVVKIPDAIECFKRHKHMERKQNKEAKKKKMQRVKTKTTKVQDCRYLCTIFGHKIAKQLNKPVQITLNTELQKISNVVSIEIEKLLCKGYKVDNRTINNNKKVKAEVSGKITIWISNILEATAFKILEEQLKDLEEEVGPVLDLIDNLVDNVVEICEPVPEFIEVSSSSETYNIESSTDNEEPEESQERDTLSFDVDFPSKTQPVELNLDEFIKTELDIIIKSFDEVIPSDGDDINLTDVENQTSHNIIDFKDEQDHNQQNNIEFEDIADKEQNEFEDANDTFEVPISEIDAQSDTGVLQAEGIQNNPKDPERDLVNDSLSEDDSNKKVKFCDINMVTTDDITEQGPRIIPKHYDSNQLTSPNYYLLSNTDEPWPEELSLPILRPSESVSKSITSLGNIMEADEKMSVMLEDDANGIKGIVNVTTTDENADGIAGIRNDTKIDAKAQEDINSTVNTIAYDNDQLKEGNEMGIINLTITTLLNDDRTIHEAIDLDKSKSKTDGDIDMTSHDIEKDEAEPIDTYKDKYRRTDNSNQEMYKKLTDLPERIYTYNGNNEKTYSKEHDIEKDSTDQIDEYIGGDGKTYTKEQLIEKYGTKQADQIVGKGIIIKGFNHLAEDSGIHRSSADSTFDHDVETEPYEQKLDKILEEKETQVAIADKILEDEPTQVGIKDETFTFASKKAEIKTADKEINTSFSIVRRTDKSTSVESHSLGDITERLRSIKIYDMFSSLRIKRNVDYKVQKNSAPSWVTRNYAEPRDSSYITSQHKKKRSIDKNIRLWCKDLENGYHNLELWNGWIENTTERVKIMEMKKARICIDKSREEFVTDWLHLKKNVDADVLTWTKLSKSTQEKLKGFRNIFKNFETPQPPPPNQNKICNSHT